MTQTEATTKQYAHELIDLMAPGKLAVAVGVLHDMLDPLERALANAPYEDEEDTEEERAEAAEAVAAYKRGEIVAHEDILQDLGLTADDWDRMGQTSLDTQNEPRPL